MPHINTSNNLFFNFYIDLINHKTLINLRRLKNYKKLINDKNCHCTKNIKKSHKTGKPF